MPETTPDPPTVFDLEDVIALYMLRVDAGTPPDRDEFVTEHPAWADSLRDYFTECDELAGLTHPPEAARPVVIGPAPPREFGDYELIEEVGRGGMGVVYKARDGKLGRVVALKMVPAAEFSGRAALDRFRREAEATARLDHPHIVPVYEVGEHAGLPYFAMKWYDGGTLRAAVPNFAGKYREAAGVLAAVARAVHHAHQRGVLHRDLKPGNVFLGADGEPAVGDFGLAKWFGPDSRAADELTRPGAAFGTPGYVAPEQAAGEKGLTTAVDVYGLGAILYELLTGHPPYPSGTPLGSLLAAMRDDPARPRAINPAVPRDLEVIALKCLEREPHRRYASAAALADDLERFIRGEPILARPAGLAERVRKWARRRPGVAALTAATLLVSAVGLFGVVVQWQRAVVALDEARVAREKEAEQAGRVRAALAAHHVTLADHEFEAGRIDRADALLDDCPPELRCWEWFYLKRLCHPPARPLGETPGAYLAVAVSPSGRWLAGGGDDRVVRLWDAKTWTEVRVLKGHAGRVTSLAFDPTRAADADGPAGRLLSGSADGSVKVWDLATGQVLVDFRDHAAPVLGVAFGPGGTLAASAGEDHVVNMWNPTTGTPLGALHATKELVTAVALGRVPQSKNGTHLATGTTDGAVQVWDAAAVTDPGVERKPVYDLAAHGSVVRGVAFSPDGKLLATVSGDQTGKVWDMLTGKLEAALVGHRRDVTGVSFGPTGRHVATSGDDGSVRLWYPQTGRQLFAFHGHRNRVSGVAFHPDGRRVVSAGRDGRVLVWDAQDRQDVQAFGDTPADSECVAVSPDAARVVGGGPDGVVRVWNSGAPNWSKPVCTLPGHTGPVKGVAFHPDGKQVASAGSDGTIRIWDTIKGAGRGELRGHGGPVNAVAFGPGGRLVSAGADGSVRLWDVEARRELRTLTGHPGGALAVAFGPDGRLVVSGGADGFGRVWDVEPGLEVCVLRRHRGAVWGVAFSPDGRHAATTGADGAVRVWDAADGRVVSGVTAHGSDVMRGVAFSPDGRRLAVGCSDRTVKLLDPLTGREALALHGHLDEVRAVAFSADRTGLVSMGVRGEIRLWRADAGSPRTP